ncbi:zinc-binding dehydrogenase [Brevibacillus daliensis]|uniref:zinc-binding dehydrogenase n=1 Tax=Brevibacillus daliensis TaxID=2892995 RepID=UPI001E503AB8|nr:zinc-binding dehydrogenase [Brevibacillus daliensis]
MKAIVVEQHGEIDQLTLHQDYSVPKLGAKDARICIKYCALNHLDLWLRRGGTGDRLTLPRISGSDIVGIVEEIGDEVRHLKVGQSVLIYPGFGCGNCEACATGKETMCRQFQIIGYHVDGGYADFVTVPASCAVPIEANDLSRWAAVPVSYITAWNALVTKGGLHINDTVVIWGAAGGIGYAALQIASGIGAEVIAIVGSPDKAAFLQEQGFTGHILTRDKNLSEEIRKLTQKRGATMVLDHVGAKTWQQSISFLSRGGRLITCGVTTGYKSEIDIRQIFGKQISIYGSWMGDRSDFLQVVSFLQKNPSHLPYLYQEFALEEAREAQECLEKGNHVGKIVLNMDR